MKGFRPGFTSNLAHGLALGTPNFYIAHYGKRNNVYVVPLYDKNYHKVTILGQ